MEVIETVLAFTIAKGFRLLHLDFSPIRGPEGNIEYLMHIDKNGPVAEEFDAVAFVNENYADLIKNTVENVHEGSSHGKAHKECRCRYVDMTIFVMTIFVMKYSS